MKIIYRAQIRQVIFISISASWLYLYFSKVHTLANRNGSAGHFAKNTSLKDRAVPLEPRSSCALTVVTAYFRIPNKFSHAHYVSWMSNFLTLKSCLIIFTDNLSNFEALDPSSLVLIQVNLRQRVYEVFNLSEEFWIQQVEIDPEKDIHKGMELYWVWALKTHFVAEAARRNEFSSDYFMWLDIGVFRDDRFLNKDIRSLRPPSDFDNNSVYYGCPYQFDPSDLYVDASGKCMTDFSHKNRLAGGIFVLHKSVAFEWFEVYKDTLYEYKYRTWFAGKDQNVLATACIEFPTICTIVPSDGAPGNEWYTLIYYMFGLMPHARPRHLR